MPRLPAPIEPRPSPAVAPMRRRLAGAAAGATLGALLAPGALRAQPFPGKPLRFVVPSAQGTGVDILVRAFAERIRATTGQPTVVENKVGGGGVLGLSHFLSLPADGHTVVSITSSSMNLVPMMQSVSYDESLLRPVIGFSQHTGMFLASPSSNYTTLKKMVDDARAAPGTVNMGIYSPHFQVALRIFEDMIGARFNVVQYKGPDLFLGLGEGSIPLALADLGTAVRFVESGKNRPLATAAATRHPSFPDVPTVAELGYPGYEVHEIAGFAINAKTPEPQVRQMEELLLRTAADPEYQAMARRLPGAVLTQTPGREFAAMLSRRRAVQEKLLKELKLHR